MTTTSVTVFKTVFDLASRGYTGWWFALPGLFMAYVGHLVATGQLPKKRPGNPILPRLPRRESSPWIFPLVIIALTLLLLGFTYRQYRTGAMSLKEGKYKIVEGPVTDFTFSDRARDEKFTVAGKRFSYSHDYQFLGYHAGGPIHEGLYVRISYVRNTILRLEIAQ
jgi:hypothetical protein